MADKKDPKLCWSCGKRGEPAGGSKLKCVKCDVTWMPFGKALTGS